MKRTADPSRRDFLKALGAGSGLLVVPIGPLRAEETAAPGYDWDKHFWAYAVDTTKCIGCGACMRGCRDENDVPAGYFRTWIERYRIHRDGRVLVDAATTGEFVFTEPTQDTEPGAIIKAFFVPKICNHCTRSVCSQVCPVGASYTTRDGVVLVDEEHCIGCGYCVQACPYGTRFIAPGSHVADKCTFCYHRITRGLPPACVASCPTGARLYGDLKDPKSQLSTILSQNRYRLLRPEMGTHPKCYYLGLDREVV